MSKFTIKFADGCYTVRAFRVVSITMGLYEDVTADAFDRWAECQFRSIDELQSFLSEFVGEGGFYIIKKI